jgi:hypothetical protein
MENSVLFGEDAIIYVTYQGDQNYEIVSKINNDIDKAIKNLREQHKPVLIHVDLTKLGKTTSDARKIGLTLMKTMDFDRVALVGRDTYTKYITNFMITAAQQEEKIRYFSSEEEARKWLPESI